MKKPLFLLLLIFFIGTFLRFYHLGDIPRGFHRDEAFLGYNAYSILKTGKDMNGIFLPIHLKSFVYSPAGYSYFSVPFIKIFGLSEFSVRFASAFFGSATILLIFFIVKELFDDHSYKIPLCISSSVFFAFSPWHLNLSRTSTENVIVLFFICLGLVFFLRWSKGQKKAYLFISFLSFGITLLIYQAPRAFLPLFIPTLFIFLCSKREVKKNTLPFFLCYIFIILIPLFLILSSKDLSLRIRTVSIFATRETQLTISEYTYQDALSHASYLVTRVFHNKIFGYTSQFFQNYFSHFTFNFLFTDKGFPDRYRVPLMGIINLLELPFLLLGILALIKETSKRNLFFIAWILLVPVGSALTFDDIPNLQRTLLIVPPLSICSAFGLVSLHKQFKQNRFILRGLFLLVFTGWVYILFFYFHQYYGHTNLYRPWYRQDGYKELVFRVNSYLPQYKKAIITNRESAPTIFFLFYNKYSPDKFQEETKNTIFRDFDRIGFGNYQFSQEECPSEEENKEGGATQKDILYVDSGLCKKKGNVLSQIKRFDNTSVFYIYNSTALNAGVPSVR